MLGPTGHLNEVPRMRLDPMKIPTLFAQRLDLARKNEKSFNSAVTMDRHRDAGRDRSFEDTGNIVI